ncbi:helix-turn-helix transcriptional regulator [Hafnia paralvei]|uniref:HTH luxR-type domain-containing protein n=1 Tax=Hafnia paralvei TaxID=546367 RepID=A0A4V2J7P1_9GAMM|nr:LuxR C-terminal-related transcriptional regulator [Hafnia paralvei]TBM28333.1 hypothetical protein EYY89_09095 [Hafnia paralvei]
MASFKLHCQDQFFSEGLYHLIQQAYDTIADAELEELVIPNILVISGKCLFDVFQFIGNIELNQPCFIFCNKNQTRILRGISGLNYCVFFLVDDSVETASIKIRKALHSLQKRSLFDVAYTNETPSLTSSEVKITRLLSDGCSCRVIQDITNFSDKAVSYYKRSSMNKLNVLSTQELIIKFRVLQIIQSQLNHQ